MISRSGFEDMFFGTPVPSQFGCDSARTLILFDAMVKAGLFERGENTTPDPDQNVILLTRNDMDALPEAAVFPLRSNQLWDVVDTLAECGGREWRFLVPNLIARSGPGRVPMIVSGGQGCVHVAPYPVEGADVESLPDGGVFEALNKQSKEWSSTELN